jgi:hypothetical protein
MWKSVENFSGAVAALTAHGRPRQFIRSGEPGAASQALLACSACAGDYEDPDRTAWTPDWPDAEELLEDGAPQKDQDHDGPHDEFPAREE